MGPRVRKPALLVAVIIVISIASSADAELPALIPREVLLGNPLRADPEISPDGQRLAWLQSDKRGVLQVRVQTIGANDALGGRYEPMPGERLAGSTAIVHDIGASHGGN